jgi:hypothetical protein
MQGMIIDYGYRSRESRPPLQPIWYAFTLPMQLFSPLLSGIKLCGFRRTQAIEYRLDSFVDLHAKTSVPRLKRRRVWGLTVNTMACPGATRITRGKIPL